MSSPDQRHPDEADPDAHHLSRGRLYSRIRGSLTTAALGDAMGARVEHLATHEIVARHGGLLRELASVHGGRVAEQGRRGEYTDDASQMFALAATLAAHDGELPDEAWLEVLVEWARSSPSARFAGPTMRRLLQAPAGDSPTIPHDPSFGATNGSAMRVAPAGLVRPGDVEGAVHLAWASSRVTHDTQLAAAGAGAIAAGAAAALAPGADVGSTRRAA